MNKKGEELIAVFNWTPNSFDSYRIGVPKNGTYKVVFDTSLEKFGGDKHRMSGSYKSKKGSIHGYEQYIDLKLHGLSAMFLKKTADKQLAKKDKPVKAEKEVAKPVKQQAVKIEVKEEKPVQGKSKQTAPAKVSKTNSKKKKR